MNAKEILGRKIIDVNAQEVAKISELVFDIETYKIIKIYGSSGNPISRKYYEILKEDIIALGDYLLLNKTKSEIEANVLDKIPDAAPRGINLNNNVGKTVLDSKGNIVGKISDIDINIDEFKVVQLTVKQTSSFGRSRKQYIITTDDIISNGDYIIINKELTNTTTSNEDNSNSNNKSKEDQEDSYKDIKIEDNK